MRSSNLKGKGIRDVDGRRKGNLYGKVIQTTPANQLSEEQRFLLFKLAEIQAKSAINLKRRS